MTNALPTAYEKPAWQRWLILLSMCFAVFNMGLMSTGVVVAMTNMRVMLHMSAASLPWIMNSYLLAAAAMIIFAGRMSEIYGRRNIFILGLLIFLIGSIIVGVSPNGATLITGRTIQGVAAAIVAQGTLAILKLIFPPEQKVFAVTTWATAAGLGFSSGPIIGGALTGELSWRYLFWLAAIILILSFLLLMAGRSKNKGLEGSRVIDWWGFVLLLLFIVPLFLGLIQGLDWGWNSPWVIGLLIWGGVFFVIMSVVELKRQNPLVMLRFFSRPQFFMGAVGICFNSINLFVVLYFITLYLETPFFLNYSPIMAGVALLPFSLGFFVASMSVSSVLKRISARFALFIVSLFQAGGLVWLCFISSQTTYVFLWAPFLLIGLGVGFNMASFPMLGLMAVDEAYANRASGLVNMTNYFGCVLGPSIGSIFFVTMSLAVFSNYLHRLLLPLNVIQQVKPALLAPASHINQILQHHVPSTLHSQVIIGMQHSLLIGFRAVLIMGAILGLLMAVMPLFLLRKMPGK